MTLTLTLGIMTLKPMPPTDLLGWNPRQKPLPLLGLHISLTNDDQHYHQHHNHHNNDNDTYDYNQTFPRGTTKTYGQLPIPG